MRLDTELLNNIYRNDVYFQKLKEVWDRWKNHPNKRKHIADTQKDLILLKLKVKFTKYPDVLIDQLLEVNFKCKDCFKAFIKMYRFTLQRNEMSFKCKKEYLRKMIKVHRNILDRIIKELNEKNMVLIEKTDGYFRFTLNLSFLDWNISEYEKQKIIENIEKEIEWYDEKYIQEEEIL